MKKIAFFFLVTSLTVVTSYGADVTLYKNVRDLNEVILLQPAIIEVSNLNQLANFMVTTKEGVAIPQQITIVRKSRISTPQKVEACIKTCVSANALADGNENTTFDFPLTTSGIQKGTINIIYSKPLETNQIVFKTTQDSYLPSSFILTIDGKRILNNMEGGSAKFPKMMAQSISIEFEYNQPLRFTEVGVGSIVEEDITSSVRFVYEPKRKYLLYLNSPLGRESLPQPSINLFAKISEREASLGEEYANSLYKERDSDNDGVINSVDNCVMQANPRQEDGNTNGIGDACDDYDYDGVMTYVDNCPNLINANQSDKDNDGIGDVCDPDESRITEKYKWLPWAIFIGVFLAILGMGYQIVLNKKVREIK